MNEIDITKINSEKEITLANINKSIQFGSFGVEHAKIKSNNWTTTANFMGTLLQLGKGIFDSGLSYSTQIETSKRAAMTVKKEYEKFQEQQKTERKKIRSDERIELKKIQETAITERMQLENERKRIIESEKTERFRIEAQKDAFLKYCELEQHVFDSKIQTYKEQLKNSKEFYDTAIAPINESINQFRLQFESLPLSERAELRPIYSMLVKQQKDILASYNKQQHDLNRCIKELELTSSEKLESLRRKSDFLEDKCGKN